MDEVTIIRQNLKKDSFGISKQNVWLVAKPQGGSGASEPSRRKLIGPVVPVLADALVGSVTRCFQKPGIVVRKENETGENL